MSRRISPSILLGGSGLWRALALTVLTLCSAGCGGFEQLESGQHGVVFSKLPTFFPKKIAGGVGARTIGSGEMVFIAPWEQLYRLDTSLQSVGWGGVGYGSNTVAEDYLETRALDGNEVGLAVSVQYNVKPEAVAHVIQRVAVDDAGVRRLVSTVARADIRTYMNTLRTPEYFSPERRSKAMSLARESLRQRLGPEGIEVVDVVYYDHRFERRLPDGSVDSTYQHQIDSTQATNQQTEQELKKIVTVVESKKQEYNEAQARVNRIVEEAEGFRQQAAIRGDSYLEAKRNEAAQVTAVGMAEVEGVKKQVEALSGPGGRALLRLAISKALAEGAQRYVVINNSRGEGGLDISRVDTNELLRQAGLFAAVAESSKPANTDTHEREKERDVSEKKAPN